MNDRISPHLARKQALPTTSKRVTMFAGAAALVLLSALLVGCGGDSKQDTASGIAAIKAATTVDTKDFPQADGKKTFEQLRSEAKASSTNETVLLPAANDFVAGRINRLPFGLFEVNHTPVWGPTVMYIAATTTAPAQGPFAVAAHALDVPQKYRSKTSADDYEKVGNGFYTAVFDAGKSIRQVHFMTLTQTAKGMRAAVGGLKLTDDDPAPAPGEKAPAIKTPTLADVNGKIGEIDTRVPPDTMHKYSLDEALKLKKPIVLIFATPALCASRVCGPVVDVASEVQDKVGDKAIFIHQEIYNKNDPNKGFRKQVGQYGLTAEPFTFVIDDRGRIAAQLQGPFVAKELDAALKVAGL